VIYEWRYPLFGTDADLPELPDIPAVIPAKAGIQ
jgi:hypothetical protein